MAIAGRIGVELDLEDFDKFSRDVPLVANLQPSGAYFMEDLYYAGGLPAVMHAIERYLHTDVLTVNGQTLGENRSEEHTSELQSLMRISYAVFCLKKKKLNTRINQNTHCSQKTNNRIECMSRLTCELS